MIAPETYQFILSYLGGPVLSYVPQEMTRNEDGSYHGELDNGGIIDLTNGGSFWDLRAEQQGGEIMHWHGIKTPFPPVQARLWTVFSQNVPGDGNQIIDVYPVADIIEYVFSANTNMDNGPASGSIKFNSLNFENVNTVNISIIDFDEQDRTAEIEGWASAGKLVIQSVDDPGKFGVYTLGAVTDPQAPDSGYRQIAVTFFAGQGTMSDDDHVTLAFYAS